MLKLMVVLAFGVFMATSALADSAVVGRADFLIQSDQHGPLDTQISESANGHLSGEGVGFPAGDDVDHLIANPVVFKGKSTDVS